MHRIGRTGRSGKRGLATTFINRRSDLTVLADLKHLLLEAGQQLPLFLKELEDDDEVKQEPAEAGNVGCTYCSGLGHRIGDCPKKQKFEYKVLSNCLSSMGDDI